MHTAAEANIFMYLLTYLLLLLLAAALSYAPNPAALQLLLCDAAEQQSQLYSYCYDGKALSLWSGSCCCGCCW